MKYNQLVAYPEWVYHDNNSYLTIPKNACTLVRDAISQYQLRSREIDEKTYSQPNTNIKWTVIREPYDRLISGLSYDMEIAKVDKSVILKNFEQSLFGSTSPMFRYISDDCHTYTQSCYLVGKQIDVYVDIEDVSLFLEENFDYVNCNKVNVGSDKYKEESMEIIEIIGEERVRDMLSFDTFIYNSIKNSADLWKWQHGRIFNDRTVWKPV